jgi:hypothetical protein
MARMRRVASSPSTSGKLHGLAATAGLDRLMPRSSQVGTGHLAVHLGVVGHQHAQAALGRRNRVFDLGFVRNPRRKLQPEDAAAARVGPMPYVSAHPAHQPTGDRETQPGALDACSLGAEPHELLEETMALVLGDSDAGIHDFQSQSLLVPRQADFHRPARRVFHRIAEQVHQDLPELYFICNEPFGCAGGGRIAQFQPPASGGWGHEPDTPLDQAADVDQMHMQYRAQRLDPRIVEHCVDHVAHVLARGDDTGNLL